MSGTKGENNREKSERGGARERKREQKRRARTRESGRERWRDEGWERLEECERMAEAEELKPLMQSMVVDAGDAQSMNLPPYLTRTSP